MSDIINPDAVKIETPKGVASVEKFFSAVVPVVTPRNFQTQLGVHFEEIGEMLNELQAGTGHTELLLDKAKNAIRVLSKHLKESKPNVLVPVKRRKDFLDAILDQIVTGTGLGYMQQMDVSGGLEEVNRSNYTKLDEHGNATFDQNKKFIKPASYIPPDLTPYV